MRETQNIDLIKRDGPARVSTTTAESVSVQEHCTTERTAPDELKFLQNSWPDAVGSACKVARKIHARIPWKVVETQGLVGAKVSQTPLGTGFIIQKAETGYQIRTYARHSYILQFDDEIIKQIHIRPNLTRLGFYVLERGIFIQPCTRLDFIF